jgi:hypothetical protein
MRHDDHMSDAQHPRGHLTGTLTVEWVDAADPEDAIPVPNFGWSRFDSDPPLDRRRLLRLLLNLAESVREELDEAGADT